jgi:Fe(3+) dicitrate transport protein
VQNRFILGPWSITPGVRVERVNYERTNRLADATGRTDLLEVIPGVGAAYSATDRLTVFAGAHRGFTPPRTEDVINNSTGGVIELDPERSWNYEAGLRGRIGKTVQLEAAYFRMDYENQVIPASLAGGAGSTLTNGGATVHQGFELSARFEPAAARSSAHNVYARTAYTWLPVARFEGVRFSSISGFREISVTGNRLPYAPEHLVSTAVGYVHARGFDVNAEAVFISDQFGDDLNTVEGSADGQRGLLPGHTLWNAAANYPLGTRAAFFAAVKNIFDTVAIVDRSRGILPTMPRTVQAGVKLRF